MFQLLNIFINILVPVFALILVGYIAGPILKLDARTLSRISYFILTPAFIFDMLSTIKIEASLVLRMTLYILAVHVICALVAFLIARLLRRSADMTAVYVMMAVFGNVANFGLPIVQFALGKDALAPAAIYVVAILTVSFVLSVGAASWARGNGPSALLSVLKTPALLSIIPALLLAWLHIAPPVALSRAVSLLAGALIPVMLVALGVQLAAAGIPRINLDMVLSNVMRLIGAPALAIGLATPFLMTGMERNTAIIQSSMPAAVLVSMIALENDLMPEFVTTAVLFSTLASMVTLTVVLALI